MSKKTDKITLKGLTQELMLAQAPCEIEHHWKQSDLFKDDEDHQTLKALRLGLYQRLGKRNNASMDLIDALACQTTAKSATELSEQAQFKRQYSSVRDAIHYASYEQNTLNDYMMQQGLSALPNLCINGIDCKVVAVDSTPMPHAHASCLPDRSYIHDASNQVTGKPINIGHEYSAVVGVTEQMCWVCPLKLNRIPSEESPSSFGMNQVMHVCRNSKQPVISLMDSRYNTADCRLIARRGPSAPIVIVRSQCNRGYYLPAPPKPKGQRGAQKRYGERIHFINPSQGPKPDIAVKIVPENQQGCLVVLFWQTTYTKLKGMNGYEDPSSVLAIYEFREDGTLKYQNPMVLRVFVPEQHCFFPSSLSACLYSLRFSIEHFFSATKKHTLFGRFQSPELEHQTCFSLMGYLAYQQWYFAKMSGPIDWVMKPWHRYPKCQPKGKKLIPSHVQKGYANVLQTIGTPSVYRPPSHTPKGRSIGETQDPRPKQPVIRKAENKPAKDKQEEKIRSDAPSMDSETKRSALETAAQMIARPLRQAAHAVGMLMLMIIFLAPDISDEHLIISQSLISAPSEISVLSSNGVEKRKLFYQNRFTNIFGGRSPPNAQIG